MRTFLRDVVLDINVPAVLRVRALTLLTGDTTADSGAKLFDYLNAAGVRAQYVYSDRKTSIFVGSGIYLDVYQNDIDAVRGLTRIRAIKVLRDRHNWSLRDALEIVNYITSAGLLGA